MFEVGDYVVYKKDVCLVKKMKTNQINHNVYYVLVPITDDSLLIDVPIENRCGHLRPLLTRGEVTALIESIPSIPVIESSDRMIENEYKTLLASDKHSDLIKIIKTTYLRNKERIDNKKKIGDKDSYYFDKAEKYLYNEFSIVLGMDFEETKKYMVDKVSELIEKNEN